MTDKLKPVAYATKSFLESITGLGDIVTFKNDSDDLQKCEKIGLYDQQQVDQLQAQIAELTERVESLLKAAPDDGWIEWSGGDMPVAEGVFVDVKFRNGKRFLNYSATEYYWSRDVNEGGCDIIAYRVVKP